MKKSKNIDPTLIALIIAAVIATVALIIIIVNRNKPEKTVTQSPKTSGVNIDDLRDAQDVLKFEDSAPADAQALRSPGKAITLIPKIGQMLAPTFNANGAQFTASILYKFHSMMKAKELTNVTETQALITMGDIIGNKDFQPKQVFKYTTNNPLGTQTSFGGLGIDYVSEGRKLSMVFLRGTIRGAEWYSDSKFLLKRPTWVSDISDIKVHRGIDEIYSTKTAGPSLREQVMSYLQESKPDGIVIAGHSLGGGLATLIGGDMSVNAPEIRKRTQIYTFGAPIIGNTAFVDAITNVKIDDKKPNYTGIFVVENQNDPVSKVIFPYYKPIPSQVFTIAQEPAESLSALIKSHDLRVYMNNIGKYSNVLEAGGAADKSEIYAQD